MKIIWVSLANGNDVTGDGSQENPYAGIERALQDFANEDQIRILEGTYHPSDSIIISESGSLFAEYPGTVTIQPQKTTKNAAGLVITNAERFSIYGIEVLQALNKTGNSIGIYANDVDTFLAYTCAVSDFEIPSGAGYGILARGLSGRVENCRVSNMACGGGILYGIRTNGINVIDCEVASLSGAGDCELIGIQVGFEEEEDDMAFIELRPGDAVAQVPTGATEGEVGLDFINDGTERLAGFNFVVPAALRSTSPLILRFYFFPRAIGTAILKFQFSSVSTDASLRTDYASFTRSVVAPALNQIHYIDIDLSQYFSAAEPFIYLALSRDSSVVGDTMGDMVTFMLAITNF